MINEEERKLDVMTLKKKNLLSLLQPSDAFRFNKGRAVEYLFVKRIRVRGEIIKGKYLDHSGRLNDVVMSFDEIISRNPRIAYFQEILAVQ